VLIVEDVPERLLRDEEIFAALGYEPVGISRAEDAQAMCRDSPNRFDVVVVGHLAPMAAALDLAVVLHEIAPGLPNLVATASADVFGANALATAGISDVVAWPIIATEMAMALQECLRRRVSQEDRASTRYSSASCAPSKSLTDTAHYGGNAYERLHNHSVAHSVQHSLSEQHGGL
jgi:DNA-binding NtrC family response regulator